MCHREEANLFIFLMVVTVTLLAVHQMILIYYKSLKVDTPMFETYRLFNKSIYLPNVVMHLDLKGFPPKLSYLISLAPKLQELGVTGFLIEYEDMFPYEGELVNLSRTHAYKKTELQEFFEEILDLGFDIIPLIQTFGHMEYVLKNKEFEHLRELPHQTNVICPSKTKSRALIRKMLKQVIRFHQNFPLKYFHIGCDEVYHINKCGQCIQCSEKDIKIFLKHVKSTAAFVKKLSPDTTVLIWDDMIRDVPLHDLEEISDMKVEPVYWDYTTTVRVKKEKFYDYHKKFENIWIASAFKGADGGTQTLPNLRNRFSNHLSWMKVAQNYQMNDEQLTYSFKGIILTGWSKYFHGAPPCELLPVSIPSLFLNLLLITKFKTGNKWTATEFIPDFFDKNLKDDFLELLQCNKIIDIDHVNVHNCDFDGKDLYEVIVQCNDLVDDNLTEASDKYSDSYSVEQNGKYFKLRSIKEDLVNTLSRYYDKPFVEEYVNYRFNAPMKREIDDLDAITYE